ncbi:hypothetical protein BGZ65_008134 [Modicella reniformis]|uniref:GATA-type domain-containing protein n=1 Tax=Modicella reniformis TaxID=1440133 RepID=A0A9P6SUW8_9FUNG|nr:hypothetical protein BGZ65_008134 [Modicella reniformis]
MAFAHCDSQKLHGKPRPFFRAKDGTIKIHRTIPEHAPCATCGSTKTSVWKKGPNNEPICLTCSLTTKHKAAVVAKATRAIALPSSSTSSKGGSRSKASGSKPGITVSTRSENGRYTDAMDESTRPAASGGGGGVDKRKRSAVPKQPMPGASHEQAGRISGHGGYLLNTASYSSAGWEQQYYQRHHELQPSSQYMTFPSGTYPSLTPSPISHGNNDGTFGGSGYYWEPQSQQYYPSTPLHHIEEYPSQQQEYHQHTPYTHPYQYQFPDCSTQSNDYSATDTVTTVNSTYSPSATFPSAALANGTQGFPVVITTSSSAIPEDLSPSNESNHSPFDSQAVESTHSQSPEALVDGHVVQEQTHCNLAEAVDGLRSSLSLNLPLPPDVPMLMPDPSVPRASSSVPHTHEYSSPAESDQKNEDKGPALVTTLSSDSELSSVGDDWEEE